MRRGGLILLALALCAGCATRSKKFDAPDSSKLIASSRRLNQAVADSEASAKEANDSLSKAQSSSDDEGKAIATIEPKLDNLFKVAPVDLRPEIASIQSDVSDLHTQHAMTVAHLQETQSHHAELAVHLQEADVAKADVQKFAPAYFDSVNKLAKQATELSATVASQANTISWYRWHWWGSWIALGAGIIACGFLAFLKFTGKLALVAGEVAAKV